MAKHDLAAPVVPTSPAGTSLAGEAANLAPSAPRRSDSARPEVSPAVLASCAERRAARRTEIDRDADLVADALCEALRRLAAPGACRAPEQLWASVGEAVEASRAAYRSLNDARITLRACRDALHADSAPLPTSLRWFRHRGNYRGTFGSMAELGHCLCGALGITERLTPGDRTMIARELHLRGDIWTIDLEGEVHVFGRPGSSADQFLACERPTLACTKVPAP